MNALFSSIIASFHCAHSYISVHVRTLIPLTSDIFTQIPHLLLLLRIFIYWILCNQTHLFFFPWNSMFCSCVCVLQGSFDKPRFSRKIHSLGVWIFLSWENSGYRYIFFFFISFFLFLLLVVKRPYFPGKFILLIVQWYTHFFLLRNFRFSLFQWGGEEPGFCRVFVSWIFA